MVGIRIRLGHTTMHQESKLERHIGNKQQPNSVDRSNGNISTVIQRQYWNITKHHVGLEFGFGTSVGPKRNETKQRWYPLCPLHPIAGILALIGRCCSFYDYVILDLPRGQSAAPEPTSCIDLHIFLFMLLL